MRRLGFTRTRNDGYRHPEGILVEDLHDENGFIDEGINLIVIDPVIYLAPAWPGKNGFAQIPPSFQAIFDGKQVSPRAIAFQRPR